MKKVWISILWSMNVFLLARGDRCHLVGSATNAREFVLHYRHKQQVVMCDGNTVFDPQTCSCIDLNDGCDKRPISRDGTVFQQLTQAGKWVNMPCPGGTIFIREFCLCNFGSSIPISRQNSECYMEGTRQKSKYRIVINNIEHTMSCPHDEVYDPNSCACIRIMPDCDKREWDQFGHFFQQRTHKNHWVKMQCAEGTKFNLAKCECDHM